LFLENGQRIHQQSGWVGSPDVSEPVTKVGVHQSFAVSILSISTAAIKTGWRYKEGGHMARRQKKSGFVERFKQSFHRFWNEQSA
jgi:hypothetical protein